MSNVLLNIAATSALAAFGCLGCNTASLETGALATGQQGVTSMTADGGFVYWGVQSGEIRRVSVDGGEVESVVSGINTPTQIAVDDVRVYWASLDGDIASAPKAGGGSAKIISSFENDVVGIRVDDAGVYWARATGEVRSGSKDGSSQARLVASDASGATSLGQHGTTLYWTSGGIGDGAVRTADDDGMSADPAITEQLVSPRNLALNATQLFWSGTDADAVAADPKSQAQLVSGAGLGGESAHPIITQLENVSALVADETSLYLAADDSTTAQDVGLGQTSKRTMLVSVAISSGAPVVFATGPSSKTTMAIDLTTVYWAHVDEDVIFALPKP